MSGRIYSRGTPIERAMRHIRVDENGCWLWDGALTTSGYGHLNAGGGRYVMAHVLIYEHHRGPVPAGRELDHLCRVRRCCNPEHVEPVTHRENVLRGAAPAIALHLAGRCARGHPVAQSYRRLSTGRIVQCRACRREKYQPRRTSGACARCGAEFEGRVGRIYCCDVCRRAARTEREREARHARAS